MAVQLPPEIQGTASGVLLYTFICLLCSIALLAAAWAHGERLSYVVLLAVSTGMSSVSSICQQVNIIIWWERLMLEHSKRLMSDGANPELILVGSSAGANLVLFYIQYYIWNVEAILLTCWAAHLALGVFKAPPIFPSYSHLSSLGAKSLAILLPAVQVGLVQSSLVKKNTAAFLIISNAIMTICLGSGSILILSIFLRYICIQRQRSSIRCVETNLISASPHSRPIYDKALIIRFAIAFFGTSALELAMILIQISIAGQNKAAAGNQRDLTPDSARLYFVLFMPGVSAGLICFAVFGTTKTYSAYLWRTMTPRKVRELVLKRFREIMAKIRAGKHVSGDGPSNDASVSDHEASWIKEGK